MYNPSWSPYSSLEKNKALSHFCVIPKLPVWSRPIHNIRLRTIVCPGAGQRACVQRLRQRLLSERQPDLMRGSPHRTHDLQSSVGDDAGSGVYGRDTHGVVHLGHLHQVQPDTGHHGVGTRAVLHAAGRSSGHRVGSVCLGFYP